MIKQEMELVGAEWVNMMEEERKDKERGMKLEAGSKEAGAQNMTDGSKEARDKGLGSEGHQFL